MLPLMLGSYSTTVIVPTVFLFICSLHRLSRVCCSSRNSEGSRFTCNTAWKLSPAFRPRFSHGKNTKRLITLSRFLATDTSEEKRLIFTRSVKTSMHYRSLTYTRLTSTLVPTWQPSENVNLYVAISLQNTKLQSISHCFPFLRKETGMYCNHLMLSVVTASFLVNVE